MPDAATAGGGIVMRFAQLTNAGGRPSNQDALGHARQDGLTCFVVSDGVGGQLGGEVAAHLVVDAIIEKFLQESSFGVRALQSYVDHAIARIGRRKQQEPELKDMSATVAAVLIDQENRCALWAHMGDTRVYRFHRNKVQAITKDHSLVQQLIDAGYCRPEQLRNHPQRSSLFAAVGAEGDIGPEVSREALLLQDGDAFLMCTDGFWEWIAEAEMENALALAPNAEEWLAAMGHIVEKRGKVSAGPHDNYTAFAIRLGEPEAETVRR